jgi:hypothetical protein
MKKIACFLVILSFAISASAARSRWKNGGTSTGVSTVKFGTHDWILWKGYLSAKDDVDLSWLNDKRHYAFFGTEAPTSARVNFRKASATRSTAITKTQVRATASYTTTPKKYLQPFAADALRPSSQKQKPRSRTKLEASRILCGSDGALHRRPFTVYAPDGQRLTMERRRGRRSGCPCKNTNRCSKIV